MIPYSLSGMLNVVQGSRRIVRYDNLVGMAVINKDRNEHSAILFLWQRKIKMDFNVIDVRRRYGSTGSPQTAW